MFFKQVWRNTARNRKGNGLFFGSLIIAIVAFYTLLSLDEQDVMRFLTTIESQAVQKLMMMIPVVYLVSLFFVFFLVYFACKYQMDNRRKEFGMYLMLGMKKSRLFSMLFGETLCSSLISLLIGLPAALFLTEGISLATAKLIGLGIIEHQVSFSARAILWTICGFVFVQLLSMMILCGKLANTEPAEFMRSDFAVQQAKAGSSKEAFLFPLGIVLLLTAYAMGIYLLSSFDSLVMLAILTVGTLGTFFLYRGLGCLIGKKLQQKKRDAVGLSVFTGRQIQENVLFQYKTLAVASLLLLLALSCISFGIGMSAGRTESRSTDFSIAGSEEKLKNLMDNPEIAVMTEDFYPVYLSRTNAPCDFRSLENALEKLPQSRQRDNILDNLLRSGEYLISESSYNHLMEAMGKETIMLDGDKMALYTSMSDIAEFCSTLNEALKQNVKVQLDETEYSLLPQLYWDNLVADRMITLYMALIVPDQVFMEMAVNPEPYCYNLHLADQLTEEKGLLQAIQDMDAKLSVTGLKYKSYLGGIGRNLIYTVSASYLTIYLGVLFLLISNTVIGLKYLIQQRQNKHRYITLLMLGADTEALCRSGKKQIQVFFNLALGVACVSSVFAIVSMFRSFMRLPEGTPMTFVLLSAGAAFLLFILTELVYVTVVKRTACREIRELKVTERR